MADPVPVFDVAAARADGVSDADIATFLAPKLGFNLEQARKDGVADSAIVDFLSPPKTPAAPAEPPKKATIGDDWQRGIEQSRAGFGAMGAAVAGARLSDVEAAKKKADAGEYLSPIERERARQYDEAKGNAQRQLEEGAGQFVEATKRADALPISPGYKAFQEAQSKGTIGDVVSAFWKAPIDVLTSMIVEGTPATMPALAAGLIAGPAGGMAVGGAQGFGQSYANTVMDLLGKRGIDVENKEAIAAALANPEIADEIRAEAAKGAVPQAAAGALGMGAGAITMAPAKLAARPLMQQAVNIPAQMGVQGAIAAGGEVGEKIALGEEVSGGKALGAFIGGASQGPVDVATFAAHRTLFGEQSPKVVADKVMAAPTVDAAIAEATAIVGQPVDTEAQAIGAREFGGRADQQQAKMLKLFGGLNEGTVEVLPGGQYQYRIDDQAVPLKVWDEKAPAVEGVKTISPELAATQRRVYGDMGIDVVYIADDGSVPFDGAVSPRNPDTIFLSNDPQRNAANVGAHEVTHVLETVTTPDGQRLGDLMHDMIVQNVTGAGIDQYVKVFGQDAPARLDFEEGPRGDSLHADAVWRHITQELGADIGGEAPKFPTFVAKVVDEVQTRYGADAAKGVMRKLMDGIQQAMRRLREMFSKGDAGAEYGVPDTVSQNWLTNLGEFHDLLAKGYAEKFGTAAERENVALRDMRDRVARQRFFEQPGPDLQPPTAPAGFTAADVTGQVRPDPGVTDQPQAPTPIQEPGAGYQEAAQRIATYRRWIGELDAQRRQEAPNSPQVRLLQQTEASILGKVNGVESRLTGAATARLAQVREQLAGLLTPDGDTADMTRLRQAILDEQGNLAKAAAVGTGPAPGTARAGALAPATAPSGTPAVRGRAVMPEDVAQARADTDTAPTDGQKEAGNYSKGRLSISGIPFVMENPVGSIRRGVDGNGKAWESKLPADYGYVSRTVGADGDQVDAYVGPDHNSQRAWVIDQIDPKTGRLDEHKMMLGFSSPEAAIAAYDGAFSDGSGPSRRAAATETTITDLKRWLADGDTKQPFAPNVPRAEAQDAPEGMAKGSRIIGQNDAGADIWGAPDGHRVIVDPGGRRRETMRGGGLVPDHLKTADEIASGARPLTPDTVDTAGDNAALQKLRERAAKNQAAKAAPPVEAPAPLPEPEPLSFNPPAEWQPSPEQLTQARRVARGWTPETELRRPQSLVDFVRKNGGLRLDTPEAGDLRAADLGRLPGLLQRRGVQSDWMAQRAQEAGYDLGPATEYGNGVNVDAFLDALAEDASGRRKHYPADRDTEAWQQQREAHIEFHNYLEDMGIKPKDMDPRQLAWVLQQEPETARLMALTERADSLGNEGSLELAYRLDAEIAQAQSETAPEPGAYEMADHRDLPAPDRQELDRLYAEYQRATGADRAGQPTAQEATPAQGTAAGDDAAARRPEARGAPQEVPATRPGRDAALAPSFPFESSVYPTTPAEAFKGKFRGVASTNEGGRLAVDAYGETAAEAKAKAIAKMQAEFDARAAKRGDGAAGPRVIVNRVGADGLTEAERAVKPVAPDGRQATPDHQFADEVARMLQDVVGTNVKIPGDDLMRLANRIYGGTLAEGKFSRDQVYDAIELGVNRLIQNNPERFSAAVDIDKAKQVAEVLEKLKKALPTQTVRAGEKDAYQQFSTPPDYAYAANWVANLKPTDHVLEPSAGVGGLIVHSMTSGVRETTVNELSDKRRGMIAALEPTRITGEDAAQLHNILPENVRPTVVVMNPPFSRAAERMGGKMVQDEGAKHIEQALSRLEPGGRLVAIVGDGMKPFGTVTEGGHRQGTGAAFRDWWNKIGREYDVRANVGVDRDIYTKYGTSFPTRFLVIDKNPPSGRELITGQARDAVDLIDRLQEVRNDRTVEPVAPQSDLPRVPEGGERAGGGRRELPGATGGMVAGEGGRARPAAEGAERTGTAGDGGLGGSAAGTRAGRGGAGDAVVPVEPQPVGERAGAVAAEPTAAGEDAAGRSADRGGDDLRYDDRLESPDVAAAPEGAIYESYRPQRVQIAGAKAHPGALVQSAAMASVPPPKTEYKPKIPAALVKSGALSDAQLEAIVYAGNAHSDVMANGKRRGYFIGDGTGVGKGREIAGIFLDNKQHGRTKGVWISEKRALVTDARRDWNGLNQPASEIIDVGKVKAGDPIPAKNGVLFLSYDTLKSAEQTKTEGNRVRGRERIDQIVEWLGKDFDGVIAFDEAHNMGNAVDEKGTRGVKKASAKALAGVALQERLPNARVVYVSATGATEIGNLSFADRLGLWGEGTAFPTRQDFVSKVSEGGVAAMELVARDMKALGHYIARNLSYDGVDYGRVEHVLTPDQRVTYDKLAEGWQVVLQNFNAALEMIGAVKDGKTMDGKAKSAAMSAFWGGHQRFFNQIITSMQMPSVIKGVEADLKAGRQAVLQLVNTNEASQERALEKSKARGDMDIEDLDMTPRDQLIQLVEKSFPVAQMEEYRDDGGNIRMRQVKDSNGELVLNKQAVAARERLIDELASIRVPEGPLEMLLNHFGPEMVAEVTGRGQRVVRKADDKGQVRATVEKRGGQANIAEAADFQQGKKKILVFSEAGGTGRSYHAAIGSGSEGARRSHYLVQGGWRADKAVQGFGRTHRTSQASAPIFNLVTTDLQGQKRFIASIARRLSQLGALTKGERRTGDQGMFSARDNLESAEAKAALGEFFRDVGAGRVEGVTMTDLEKGMGLKMRDENGEAAKELPPMSTFLNRVLSLTIDHQNRVFNAFSERLDDVIAKAEKAGTLDTGIESYKADKISKVSEQVVFTDPRSGAETKHVHLLSQTRNHPVSFEDTMAGRNRTGGRTPEGFVRNERSGRVFAVTAAGNKTDANGNIIDQIRLTSPTDYDIADKSSIDRGNWEKLKPEEARTLWEAQVAATPEFRKSDLHVITGAVLPIWDRLGGSPKIYRLQTDDGERMLARVIPAQQVERTLQKLGAEANKVAAPPAEIGDRVLGGATAVLANDWKIKPSRVAGERRLELLGPDYRHFEEMKRNGVFSERIDYKVRFFIPTEPAAMAAAIEGLTKSRPVVSLDGDGGAQFSPKRPDEEGLRNVARRLDNADENMIETIMERGSLDRPQAEAAFAELKRARALKRDAVGGRWSVKHGAFMEPDVLRRAAGADEQALVEAPDVSADMLDARQRQADKQEAEARMRGRKGGKAGQESADDLPLFGGDRQKTLFSPKSDEPFYSALTRGVEALKLDKATPGQWEATVRNMPGVKAEERAWVGLDDWLKTQPKSVTKAEVLDYLRANEIKVDEVRKGGSVPADAVDRLRRWDFNRDRNAPQGWETTAGEVDFDAVRRGDGSAIAALEALGAPDELMRPIYDSIGQGATKFSSYTLPGGENYRELLLTLPPKREAVSLPEGVRFERDPDAGPGGELAWTVYTRDGENIMEEVNGRTEAEARENATRLYQTYTDNSGQPLDRDNFRGGHWDEPNVLAHIRFDDRTGPNGERVLHIAEIQSDWHQKGRKGGYQTSGPITELPADWRVIEQKNGRGETYYEVRKGGMSAANNADRETAIKLAIEAINASAPSAQGGVPDAPFKTTWPELAMKRMLRYAAENGYDRVSWDTGETNAARFDLSQSFSRLEYFDNNVLQAWDPSGKQVYAQKHAPEDLPNVIGKEATERLLAAPVTTVRGRSTLTYRGLEGLDLKVGGEGMKAFYDKQLPVIAGKLGKKFGAKVEAADIGVPYPAVVKEQTDGKWFVENTEDGYAEGRDFPTREAAQASIDAQHEAARAHSIAITDAMREGVMQGQPLFSPKIAGANPNRTYTPAERQAFENVGRAMEPFSVRAWIDQQKENLGKRVIAKTLDPYIGIKASDPAGYMALRNANTTSGALEVFKEFGTIKFEGNAYALDRRNGGVDNSLIKPLQGEASDFIWWVAANRAERLKAEDRENLWSAEDIAVIKKTNEGELGFDYTLANGSTTRSRAEAYTDSLRKLDTFNKNALDLAVESGLLKRDQVDALWSNPFYVPFYRQAEGERQFIGPNVKGGFVKQHAFKQLKGGSEKLRTHLWENAFGNWEHMIDAAMSNRAVAGVLETASGPGGAAREMTLQEVKYLSDKELKKRTVWIMRDGEKVHYEITDPMLFDAVSTLESLADPLRLLSAGRLFKKVLTVGVTMNPGFAVRNLIRDTQQTLATAPSRINIAANMATGFGMSDLGGSLKNVGRAAAGQELAKLNLSDDAVSAIAGGATMRLATGTDTGIRDTNLSAILDTPESVKGFTNYLDTLANAYREVIGQGEDVNRFALYRKLRSEGVPHDAASFAARDLADFTLSGAATPVRYIIGVVPFLNARLQGLYKVGRAATNADADINSAVGLPTKSSTGRLATVLATSALAMMALDAIYADDEDYKKRTEFDRNTYFWFKFGDAQIRIPMGFEIAALGRMASNTAEAFYDKEMTVKRVMENGWSLLGQQLQMNPIPQAVKPLFDIAENESGTGRRIEPMGSEDLRPEQRYNANSTLIARGLSSGINATMRAIPGLSHTQGPSPLQLDYLVNAYGGWLATQAVGMADMIVRSVSNEPVKPARDVWAAATQGMISTQPRAESRYVDMLYRQGAEIERTYATYRDMLARGQAIEAQRFFDDNRETLQKHGVVGGLMRIESNLNKQIRMISNNPDPGVTAEQKRLQIMRLTKLKSDAAEQVFGVR